MMNQVLYIVQLPNKEGDMHKHSTHLILLVLGSHTCGGRDFLAQGDNFVAVGMISSEPQLLRKTLGI